jgi:uracil-DNA glycosylase family 4
VPAAAQPQPEPAEMLACEPFLLRQVALLQPALILAMGRFAVQMLLRSTNRWASCAARSTPTRACRWS